MARLPKLFRVRKPMLASMPVIPSLTTPFGRLELFLEIAGIVQRPVATFIVGKQFITTWTDPVVFEVLLIQPPIALPPGMAVDGGIAAVWRAKKADEVNSAVVKCVWAEDASWSSGGPNSGQNLDAQTWTDGQTQVSLGLPEFEFATNYRRDGFDIALAKMAKVEGHFVCAWGPDSLDDVSTWFAVDCSTSRLLSQFENADHPT